MDRLRTLLLSRTSTVVLDPDSVAGAATRPSRDVDLDRFEDELVQLGYVMSLDLAMTVRRLPHQTIQDLKAWMLSTLTETVGAHRPHVPLFRGFPASVPADTRALYLRHVLSWLFTRPEQPCPWCGQVKTVGALDPCGHLVCRSCWDGGTYAGCPICHRRIAVTDPFMIPAADAQSDPIKHDTGQLRLVDLAFDAITVARERFERLLAHTTPLSKADREEVETVIDVIGPKAAIWMPSNVAVRETMAIAVARLWMVSPDRAAMVKATQGHVPTATDVLRVAAVLMSADPALVEPMKFTSIGRGLRRSVLQALDRLPPAQLLEDVGRQAGLWKRVGEVLHPFERATTLPNAALAFALVRDTDVPTMTFAPELRAHASTLGISVEDHVLVRRWAGPVEDALRAGDARAAVARLAERPGELLRRVDHVLRVACARQPDAFDDVLRAIREAVPRGAPATLLVLGSHVRARVAPWARRVVFPKGEVLEAWGMPDRRPPLRSDAIGAVSDAVRGELVARAEKRKPFARAVIDRGLVDLLVPIGALRSVGSSSAAFAHVGCDFADFVGTGARPTMWDVAAIHAASRANVIYVRELDGSVSTVRRREGESSLARLARLCDNPQHDSQLSRIPHADAPTWFAVLRDDLAIPKGSAGYVLDERGDDGLARLSAADLVAELAR